MKSGSKKGILIVILIQVLLLAFFFKDVLIHPNQYFFELGNEAVKNYLIPGYYIKYDTGLYYTGMDYPFGEHPIFTDCQLPVTYAMKLIQSVGFNVAPYVPGVFNLMMVLSLVVAAIFLFLILQDLRLKLWYSIFCAIGISMLSPQVLRMTGHFSLSYACYIPMIWYYMMQMFKSEKKSKYVLILTLVNLFFGFNHLYYLAIILSFQTSFSFVIIILSKDDRRKKFITSLWILFATVLPIIAIEAFIFYTDRSPDRMKYPWGFFYNYASFNSVYLPPSLNPFNFVHLKNGFAEGFAYVGMVGWMSTMIILMRLIQYLFKKRRRFLITPWFLRWSLCASIIVLLFSFALPFKLGMENLVAFLGPLREFRSLGRFAWVYYYVLSITGVYLLSQVIRMLSIKRKKFISAFIISLMIIGWSVDIYSNFKSVINQYRPYKIAPEYLNSIRISNGLFSSGKNAEDFQSILSLPFHHVGSEKFWIQSTYSLTEGLRASYETGLPMIDGYMGRISLSQSMKLIQLVSDEKIDKPVVNLFKNQKPLLLIVSRDSLTKNEKKIISKSKLLFSDQSKSVYELPISAFDSPFDSLRSLYTLKKDSLIAIGKGIYIGDSSKNIFIKNFNDDLKNFPGNSTYFDSATITLFEGSLQSKIDTNYEASVWIKVFSNSFETPVFIYTQSDEKGNLVDKQTIQLISDPDNYNGWVRASCNFKVIQPGNRLQFRVKGKYLMANRFQFRPSKTDVVDFSANDGSFVLNNYYIPAERKIK